MSASEVVLILVIANFSLLCLIVLLIYRHRKKCRNYSEIIREKEIERKRFEEMIGERTRNLEMIRDSLSDFAIEKSELAQELESRNLDIRRQRDDLFKQAEKLKNAYDEIKKLEGYRQQMTRMIIHDLKNPLNLIINIAESDNMPVKSGKMIRKLSWGMLDLIMNILEVNKLENMRMKIVMTSFNLSTVINNLVEKFSFVLSSSGITLNCEIGTEIFMYADNQLTGRIFDNLISNAIKYSASGGNILISAVESGDEIYVTIKDNGTGIPQNIMNEVFTEYVYGENRSFAYSNPTGIGLAYCKLAVEAMQGKIGINSNLGAGTVVWFTLKKGSAVECSEDQQIQVAGAELAGKTGGYDLSEYEIRQIEPVILELKRTEIDEASVIIKLLDNPFFEKNEKLGSWKEKVLNAAYEGDYESFLSLLNVFC